MNLKAPEIVKSKFQGQNLVQNYIKKLIIRNEKVFGVRNLTQGNLKLQFMHLKLRLNYKYKVCSKGKNQCTTPRFNLKGSKRSSKYN